MRGGVGIWDFGGIGRGIGGGFLKGFFEGRREKGWMDFLVGDYFFFEGLFFGFWGIWEMVVGWICKGGVGNGDGGGCIGTVGGSSF